MQVNVLMLCSYAATRLRHACHMVVMGQDGRFMQLADGFSDGNLQGQ